MYKLQYIFINIISTQLKVHMLFPKLSIVSHCLHQVVGVQSFLYLVDFQDFLVHVGLTVPKFKNDLSNAKLDFLAMLVVWLCR